MGNTRAVQIGPFTGLNIFDSEAVIQDTELSECVNFDLGRAGELKKRTGFEEIHNGSQLGAGDIRILGHYVTSTISQILAYNVTQGKLYYSTDAITWTLIATISGVQHAVQYAGIMYIIRDSASGNMRSWNGTTLSADIAGSPAGTYGIIFKDRLWVFQSASATLGSRLYFSGAGDPTSWPSTNFIDVNAGDGDFLVGCGVLQDVLFVFKGKTTWGLYVQGSPENWTLRNLNPNLGAISKYAIREIEGFLYFIAADAIYRTDGTTFREFSQPIASALLGRIVNTSSYNYDALIYWENKIICLISPTPSTQAIYVYHTVANGWTKWELGGPTVSLTPYTYVPVLATTPARGVYFGSRDGSGKVYRFGTTLYTDLSVNYECRISTKQFTFDQYEGVKRGKWITVDAKGAAALSAWSETDGVDRSTQILASASTRTGIKMVGPGYFRAWKFQMTFTSGNEFMFYGLSLMMIAKRTLINNL